MMKEESVPGCVKRVYQKREVYEETEIHACVEQLVVVCENF